MKGTSLKPLLVLITVSVWTFDSPGQIFTHSFDVDAAVPDDVSTGIADVRSIDQTGTVIRELSIRLELSGEPGFSAFLGDLYAYVEHEGRIAVLLNRPGRTQDAPFGYPDNQSMEVQFSDSEPDVHLYRSIDDPLLSAPLIGSFGPDGRASDPASVLESDERSLLLGQFIGASPHGDWTLFVADLSGGGRHRVVEWGIEFELVEVPELPTWITTGSLLAWVCFVRRQRDCRSPSSKVRMGP